METSIELWHLLLAGASGISALLFLFMRLQTLKRGYSVSVAGEAIRRERLDTDIENLQKSAEDYRNRVAKVDAGEVDRALKMASIETRLTSVETGVGDNHEKDTLLLSQLDMLYKAMVDIDKGQTAQHTAMREFVHEQIRGLEAKISAGRAELFERIEKNRVELTSLIREKQ